MQRNYMVFFSFLRRVQCGFVHGTLCPFAN
jgi:hypothetical protein